mmetsp:Transcript_24317/g.35629  ORF Transcript_24317/g.35629 Transcript_24317/m.35629 type:complete len:199 (+) Transcript_24317:45-641(+)
MTKYVLHGPFPYNAQQLVSVDFSSKDALHFKGYCQGIDFSNPDILKAADRLCSYIRDRFRDCASPCLIIDGDSFSADSFTYLIPRICSDNPNVMLWAFLWNRDEFSLHRFQTSWSLSCLPVINVVLCDGALSYSDVGNWALGVTGSREVLCFGGGNCVSLEFKQSSSEVSFKGIDITRNASSGLYEHSNLESFGMTLL